MSANAWHLRASSPSTKRTNCATLRACLVAAIIGIRCLIRNDANFPVKTNACLPLLLSLCLFGALRAQSAPAAVGWDALPAILARIKAPTFPARDFPITDHGATPGGADCTEAIRKAIAACHA